MPENATPSEGVKKRSTVKVGLGETSCDLGGILRIVIFRNGIKSLSLLPLWKLLCESVMAGFLYFA